MRDPAANAIAAAEAKRVKDAIYKARTYLHWTVVHDQRWDGSRWSGQDPRLEREENFYYAVEVARKNPHQVGF